MQENKKKKHERTNVGKKKLIRTKKINLLLL